MRVPPGLQPLIDDGVIDAVLRPLKSGKEAAVYVVRSDWFVKSAVFKTSETRAFTMPWERSIDIDTLEDWLLAEYLLQKKKLEKQTLI